MLFTPPSISRTLLLAVGSKSLNDASNRFSGIIYLDTYVIHSHCDKHIFVFLNISNVKQLQGYGINYSEIQITKQEAGNSACKQFNC